MVDKVTGKTVIGISAPSDKNLVSWIKQHPSYQVLVPGGKSGKGTCTCSCRREGGKTNCRWIEMEMLYCTCTYIVHVAENVCV